MAQGVPRWTKALGSRVEEEIQQRALNECLQR